MALTQGFLPAQSQNHVSGLPGLHRVGDTYGWLEDSDHDDSDHESDVVVTEVRAVPPTQPQPQPQTQTQTQPNISGTPTGSLHDPTNSNGRRAATDDTDGPEEHDRKRIRLENEVPQPAPVAEQSSSAARSATADRLVSPPSTHRSRNGQDGQTEPQTLRAPAVQQPSAPVSGPSELPGWLQIHHRPATTAQFVYPSAQALLLPPTLKCESPLQQTTSSNSTTAIKTESTFTMQPTAPKISGPFEIDDNSDDEVNVKPKATHIQSTREIRTTPAPRDRSDGRLVLWPQITAAQKQHQLEESRRMRQEAAEKRAQLVLQTGGSKEGCSTNANTLIQVTGAASKVPEKMEIKEARSQIADPRLRNRRKLPSPGKDSVIDLTNGSDKNEHSGGAQSRPATIPHNLSSVCGVTAVLNSTGKRGATKADAFPEENKTANLLYQKAAELERQKNAEAEQRAREMMQQKYDADLEKTRAEEAQRSRAIAEARQKFALQKKLDNKKEAAIRKEEERKRQLHHEQWEERKATQERQKETQRKRQAEIEKERSVLGERDQALARLSAVRPPEPVKNLDLSAANINDVIAKHTCSPELHFRNRANGSTAANTARKKTAKIREKQTQRGLFEPADKRAKTPVHRDEDMSARDRRIKAMADRNSRMREAEDRGELTTLGNDDVSAAAMDSKPYIGQKEPHDQDEYRRHDSRAPTPDSLTVPKGPQSLSSAAGQALLAKASKAKEAKQSLGASLKRGYGRALGEVLPEDAQLMLWRDTGMRFQDIMLLYEKRFGKIREASTLTKRYRQVKEALKSAGVEQYQLDLLASGSKEASETVNRAAHGRWPLDITAGGEDDRPTRLSERARGANATFLPAGEREGTARPRDRSVNPKLTRSFDSSTTDGTLAHENDEIERRPTVGGKTMNAQAFQYYFETLAEMVSEEADGAAVRESSPITDNDYCHFEYQVQRREMSQEDTDDGFALEDDPWQIVDDPLDNLADANAKAANEALCLPKKWKSAANSELDHEYKSCTIHDGRKLFTVHWDGLGRVQTRVMREIRYHQDGILPTSKDGWAPKTIWHVRECEIVKTGFEDSDDELFEEKSTTTTTRSLDNAVYTTLEQANMVAIKHFVSIAFTPRSVNLTQRDMEIKAMERRIEEELAEMEGEEEEGEEGPVFEREVGGEGGRRMRVWVEKGELRGPRNL